MAELSILNDLVAKIHIVAIYIFLNYLYNTLKFELFIMIEQLKSRLNPACFIWLSRI